MEGETHVLVFPYSVRTSSKSIQVHANHSINVEIISDGSEEPENSEGIEAHLEHLKLNVSQSLLRNNET
uniref:Uncharacterized protein n=1 Tax=Quercus lobata TaxID=97700 RepID=A0A7N2MT32_QUELO